MRLIFLHSEKNPAQKGGRFSKSRGPHKTRLNHLTMNTATQCIILLACAAVCTSSTPILNCRCVKTIRAVSASLIARLETLPPRPYCNKKELIVVLKDGSSKCLDPKGKFAKAIEKYYRDQAEKTSTAGPKSTATPRATARATARAKARAASSQ